MKIRNLVRLLRSQKGLGVTLTLKTKNRFFVFSVKVTPKPFWERNNLTKLRIFIYDHHDQKWTHFEKIDFFNFLGDLPSGFTQEMWLGVEKKVENLIFRLQR